MSVFADVFLNPYLVDRIKSFMDYAPLHSYNLPNSFFIPGAAIKELDYFLTLVKFDLSISIFINKCI